MAKCISPFTKEGMAFPCGRCYPCLRRRVSGWSFRLVKEAEVSTSAYFITFTYDAEHIRITPRGFMTLNKRDFQLFMKNLRWASRANPVPIKYFCAGEYGTKSWRPHFHAIMFNLELSTLVGDNFFLQIQNKLIPLDGSSHKFHSPLWPHGHFTIGQVMDASVGYTLKYVMKESRVPLHANDDRVPEFQLMSKGLGSAYLTPAMKRWHKKALLDRYYLPLKDGKKVALPRYYREKIYTQIQRQSIGKHLSETLLKEEEECVGREELIRAEHYQQKINRTRLNEKL